MTNLLALECGPENTIRVALDGDWKQPAGSYGRGGILPKFARALIAAGHDPATPISVTGNGILAWARPGTLAKWAGLTIAEPEDCNLPFKRYVPMPSVVFAGRDAAHAA